MSKNDVLAKAERKVFRASFEDGLIDLGIAGFTFMFSVAPLLSVRLGDFWSSFIFLPFFGALYLLLRWVRKRFVVPRIGRVEFGLERIAKLRRGGTVMLILNLIFLVIGAVTFIYPGELNWLVALRFSAVILIFFSMVGHLYDFPRLYFYGGAAALAIPAGEWLWQQKLVSHHGFPVVFGSLTVLILLIGLYKFTRVMQREVPGYEDQPNEGGV